MAVVPDEPMFVYLNLFVAGDMGADIAPVGGDVYVDIDVPFVANAIAPIWITDKKIFGARYIAAAAVVPLYFEAKGSLVGPNGNTPIGSASSAHFADAFVMPIGLTWHTKNTHSLLYLGVNVPLGQYVVGDIHNAGLNHWVFDTNYGITWNIPNSNWEFDIDLGYSINTRNKDTDYKSGDSVHADYSVGYNFNEKLAIGASGYIYKQIEGDSGSGATLGPFKGEATGYGASITYTWMGPRKHPVVVTGEFLKDAHVKNRYEGEYFSVQIAVPFVD